jgi:hypothetical protein
MPVYKIISEETISLMYTRLLEDVQEIKKKPSISLLSMFIMHLYEYIVVYNVFYFSDEYKDNDVIEGKNINLNPLKRYLNKSGYSNVTDEYSFVFQLYYMSNNLRHEFYGNVGIVKEFLLYFIDKDGNNYYNASVNSLTLLLPDGELKDFILNRKLIAGLYLELFENEEYSKRCHKLVDECVNKKFLLKDIFNYAKRKFSCSDYFVLEVIYDCVKDTYKED